MYETLYIHVCINHEQCCFTCHKNLCKQYKIVCIVLQLAFFHFTLFWGYIPVSLYIMYSLLPANIVLHSVNIPEFIHPSTDGHLGFLSFKKFFLNLLCIIILLLLLFIVLLLLFSY